MGTIAYERAMWSAGKILSIICDDTWLGWGLFFAGEVGFEVGEFGAEENEAGDSEGSANNYRIGGGVPEPADD